MFLYVIPRSTPTLYESRSFTLTRPIRFIIQICLSCRRLERLSARLSTEHIAPFPQLTPIHSSNTMSAFNVSVSIDVGGHKETFYGQLDKRSAKQLRTQLKELCRRAIHRQPIELPSPETSPSSSPSSTPLTPIEESKQDVEEEVSSPQEQGDQRPRVWIYDIEQPIISRRARRSGSSKCNMSVSYTHLRAHET